MGYFTKSKPKVGALRQGRIDTIRQAVARRGYELADHLGPTRVLTAGEYGWRVNIRTRASEGRALIRLIAISRPTFEELVNLFTDDLKWAGYVFDNHPELRRLRDDHNEASRAYRRELDRYGHYMQDALQADIEDRPEGHNAARDRALVFANEARNQNATLQSARAELDAHLGGRPTTEETARAYLASLATEE